MPAQSFSIDSSFIAILKLSCPRHFKVRTSDRKQEIWCMLRVNITLRPNIVSNPVSSRQLSHSCDDSVHLVLSLFADLKTSATNFLCSFPLTCVIYFSISSDAKWKMRQSFILCSARLQTLDVDIYSVPFYWLNLAFTRILSKKNTLNKLFRSRLRLWDAAARSRCTAAEIKTNLRRASEERFCPLVVEKLSMLFL